ncbi:MAG: malate synthase [Thermoprotei archaeon]
MSQKPVVYVAEEVSKRFGELFGEKVVNGHRLSVEETIGALTVELEPEIERVLAERRSLLDSGEPVSAKYSLPSWDTVFRHPVDGSVRSFREIVQGLIDNFLGRETPLAWRLNENAPIPDEANPLKNPGLELTGPWHPLDMAVKQINAAVSATMGPDNEDAAPPDYLVHGSEGGDIGLFASRLNEHLLLSGSVGEAVAVKKGKQRVYRILKPRDEWPTSFHRVPGMHLRTPHVKVNGKPAPSIIVDYVIHALNDFEPLRRRGSMLYFYQPKVQTPSEAAVVAKILWALERALGAERPGTLIKLKALYEEANAGRFLPVIMWMWRYWLIGTNVGRWDYTASLIEMWKNERVLPDPQNGSLMGMVAPHMMTYQKYNALINLMAGVYRGELVCGAPIGGMNAVMLYAETDSYGRARHNAVALRSMWMDKLRERLIGLIFVPEKGVRDERITLTQILEGRVKGRLYDCYRQSWVASPDEKYVAAGNKPLRTPIEALQALLDAQEEWEVVDGVRVAPKVDSGLTQTEKRLLNTLGLLDENGRITPWVVKEESVDTPEKLFSNIWGDKNLWGALYDIPRGEITVENIQHAFYMAANYGFQVLNGNLAAAIDDYKLYPGRVVRFMNDLATYRIFVSWLWTILYHGATVTKDGWLCAPKLTEDGVIPAKEEIRVLVGTAFSNQHFNELWRLHEEWTRAFFDEYDRLAAIRILASTLVSKHVGSAGGGLLTDKVTQLLNALLRKGEPIHEITLQLSKLLGCATQQLEADLKHLEELPQIKRVLAQTYGAPPSYLRVLSVQEAGRQIANLIGGEAQTLAAEVAASAPRFDRSKAPIIMDVLKRQFLCPNYIQHSARVLFTIADKPPEEAAKILDAVYYIDAQGSPIFRGPDGKPSRRKIVEAVQSGVLPKSALEAHDYVYDIY